MFILQVLHFPIHKTYTLHSGHTPYSCSCTVQFEWAWQHPHKSRRLNTLKRRHKSETPMAYRLRVLAAMLRTGKWCNYGYCDPLLRILQNICEYACVAKYVIHTSNHSLWTMDWLCGFYRTVAE